MINPVFSESFFLFSVLIFHFGQTKTINTHWGRVGVCFKGKLIPNDHLTKFDLASLASHVEYVQKNV